jgi:hypothetical protein
MTDKEILEQAKERAKKRAKELFRPVPPEIEAELKKETVLGNPKNLIQPDNCDE